MVELDNPFTKTNRAEFIIDHLDIEPGMTLLDAGCGPGRLTIPAAGRVGSQGKVVAMDIQDGMLLRTREKACAEIFRISNFFMQRLGTVYWGKTALTEPCW